MARRWLPLTGLRWLALQAGLSLSMRNVLSIVILLYATTLVTALGAVALAAHEILRQVWIFAIQ